MNYVEALTPGNSQVNDPVNHPAHYVSGKIECIDAIEVATEGLRGIEAMCAGNAIKYIWRFNRKGKPVEDINKAIWYLNRLKQSLEAKATKDNTSSSATAASETATYVLKG